MPAHVFIWLMAALAWIGFAILCRIMAKSPRLEGDWAICWLIVQAYVRVVHRLKIVGRENIPGFSPFFLSPASGPIGPLVVVCNHTAGVDPLLVQSACPFEIRWMMLREMMLPPFSLCVGLGGASFPSTSMDATRHRCARRLPSSGSRRRHRDLRRRGNRAPARKRSCPTCRVSACSRREGQGTDSPVAIQGTPYCPAGLSQLVLAQPIFRAVPAAARVQRTFAGCGGDRCRLGERDRRRGSGLAASSRRAGEEFMGIVNPVEPRRLCVRAVPN